MKLLQFQLLLIEISKAMRPFNIPHFEATDLHCALVLTQE